MKKKLIIAGLLLASFGASANDALTYKLICKDGAKNSEPQQVTVMDNDLFNDVFLGDDSQVNASFGTGMYQLVTSVNMQRTNIEGYAHTTMQDGKPLKIAGEMQTPVNAYDSFTLVSSGVGAAKEYRLINDTGNHPCSTVGFTDTPQKKVK